MQASSKTKNNYPQNDIHAEFEQFILHKKKGFNSILWQCP